MGKDNEQSQVIYGLSPDVRNSGPSKGQSLLQSFSLGWHRRYKICIVIEGLPLPNPASAPFSSQMSFSNKYLGICFLEDLACNINQSIINQAINQSGHYIHLA